MKSEFISSISHEFKTPLTSVIAFSNLLRRDPNFTPRQTRQLDAIQTNAWRLERMIDDLTSVAQDKAGGLSYNIQEINITDVVIDTCDSLRPVASGAGRRLFYNCPPTTDIVAADPVRLAQVILNLISNAIKYSPDRSGITVMASESSGQFQIRVRNRGELTEQETQDALVKFKRIDNERTRRNPGSGIGLSLSQQMMEEMNGTLSFKSDAGAIEAEISIPFFRS